MKQVAIQRSRKCEDEDALDLRTPSGRSLPY